MSKRVSIVSPDKKQSTSSFLKTFIESLKIFPRNKHILFPLFAFLALPLSLLHFDLTLSSYPIKSKILHLEYLATRAPTHYEARQVRKESREVALHLLHLKLFYFLPSYFLSLIAAITIVVATESAYNRKPTSLKSVFAAVKPTWKRLLVTSICIYVIQLLYSSVPHTLELAIGNSSPRLRFLIRVFGSGIELFIIAVSGMALVVSIVETRCGCDAIRAGSELMGGRRICGWLLYSLTAVVTVGIGWRMEGLMVVNSEDLTEEPKWTVKEGWEKPVLVVVYGVAVVWGFVVGAIFYCECRKRHVIRGEAAEHLEMEGDDC